MMPFTGEPLTRGQLIQDLREIVRLNPDGAGDSSECVYFRSDGTPLCLIGQVLARHGVTFEDMDWALKTPDVNEMSIHAIPEAREQWFTGPALALATVAQNCQDNGTAWPEVLAVVEGALSEQD